MYLGQNVPIPFVGRNYQKCSVVLQLNIHMTFRYQNSSFLESFKIKRVPSNPVAHKEVIPIPWPHVSLVRLLVYQAWPFPSLSPNPGKNYLNYEFADEIEHPLRAQPAHSELFVSFLWQFLPLQRVRLQLGAKFSSEERCYRPMRRQTAVDFKTYLQILRHSSHQEVESMSPSFEPRGALIISMLRKWCSVTSKAVQKKS